MIRSRRKKPARKSVSKKFLFVWLLAFVLLGGVSLLHHKPKVDADRGFDGNDSLVDEYPAEGERESR